MPRSIKSSTQRRNSSFMESTQAKIEFDMEDYAKKIQIQRRRLTNLDMLYKTLQNEYNQRKELIIQYNKSMDPQKNKLTYTRSLNAKKKTQFYSKMNDKLTGQINDLKFEIVELRRQRKILIDNINNAANDVQNIEERANQTIQIMNSNISQINEAKHEITSIRERLDREQTHFRKTLKSRKQQYEIQMRNNFMNTSHYTTQVKVDNFDTATLLKRRLQSIIINNKQKIKMIDNYQRNMKILDEAFNTIKQTSGLTNINEIQAIFVKSEQQNCALLTYLDTLNQQIDALSDINQDLQTRCKDQQQENKQRQQILNSTPQLQKKRIYLKSIAQQKMKLVNEVNDLLNKISPKVSETINLLKLTGKSKDLLMNSINYQKILGQLDFTINTLMRFKAVQQNKNIFQQILQIDTIPPKQAPFPKNINLSNVDNTAESSVLMYDYSKLQQIAKQSLKKQVQKRQTKLDMLKSKKMSSVN